MSNAKQNSIAYVYFVRLFLCCAIYEVLNMVFMHTYTEHTRSVRLGASLTSIGTVVIAVDVVAVAAANSVLFCHSARSRSLAQYLLLGIRSYK